MILAVFKKECQLLSRSWLAGGTVAFSVLLTSLIFYIDGIRGELYSGEALQRFFYDLSGVQLIAAALLGIRVFTDERQQQSLSLLLSTARPERELVLGKWLSVLLMNTAVSVATLFVPIFLWYYGKIAWGHVLVGYIGVNLVAAAAAAIAVFASAVSKNTVTAGILSAFILAFLTLFWTFSALGISSLEPFFQAASFHYQNFAPFAIGRLKLGQSAYYLAISFFFLNSSTRIIRIRRWWT